MKKISPSPLIKNLTSRRRLGTRVKEKLGGNKKQKALPMEKLRRPSTRLIRLNLSMTIVSQWHHLGCPYQNLSRRSRQRSTRPSGGLRSVVSNSNL